MPAVEWPDSFSPFAYAPAATTRPRMVTNTRSFFMGRPPWGSRTDDPDVPPRGRRERHGFPTDAAGAAASSRQLEVLQVQRSEQSATLAAEPVLAPAQRI